MLLRSGDAVERIYDYHLREIVLYQNSNEIATFSANTTKENTALALPAGTPFTVTVTTICKNCSVDDNGMLQPRDVNLEDEVNQWGIEFSIQSGTQTERLAVTEFLPPYAVNSTDKNYFIALRRHSRPLPFALRLEHFTPRYYQGTDIAKSFESAVHIIEQDHKQTWPALISMNDPLRYKGYTFYQSSFLTLPNNETASVLNVVKNAGWLFPYIATFMLFAGLLVHLGVRRHAPD